VDPEKWLNFFNRQPPALIDSTGGEPFLYEAWRELILNLSGRHRLAVTTNLAYEVSEFVDVWPRFNGVTVSFHPHSIDLEAFMAKIQELKKFQRNVGCNIVAYPDQLEKLPNYIQAIRSLGVAVHIDPYISEKYGYTPRELELLRSARGLVEKSRRMEGFNFGDTGVLKSCDAGRRHILLLPDGSCFTCMCGFFLKPEDHSMGNVFSKEWSLRQRDIVCDVSCSCGCDLDWVKFKRA